MEKFSKWRDPSTGIQPFLPLVPPSSVSPILLALLSPLCAISSLIRVLLLAVVGLVHVLLVEGVCLIFTPIPPLHRLVSKWCTAVTCRLALGVMGYFWIEHDLVSPKRGSHAIAQTIRSPQGGDLIISNHTSYVEILYLAFRHDPLFLLPIFSSSTSSTHAQTPTTGRHTGTGSAAISQASTLPQPPLVGYAPVPLLRLVALTGSPPPSSPSGHLPSNTFKSLKDAVRAHPRRPVVLLPEGTTSNGRAVLRFGEGVLADEDVGKWGSGIIWIQAFKHPSPSSWTPSPSCPLPQAFKHLWSSLLWTPLPIHPRTMSVRTLHPSASPSSPSFLPTEVLANAPGGLEGVAKDGKGAWREAVGSVLAETAKVRRVRGMGWVEKKGFLEYWEGSGASKRR